MEAHGFSDMKATVAADELAQKLFSSFVLGEETSVMKSQDSDLRAKPGFQLQAYEHQKFIYLAASIAVALTTASDKNPAIIQVIPHFRQLVTAEMYKRWGEGIDIVDSEIERASHDCFVLLFTNPKDNRVLSVDWSQTWLEQIGVKESNPVTLFLISTYWKEKFLQAAEILSQVRVPNSDT